VKTIPNNSSFWDRRGFLKGITAGVGVLAARDPQHGTAAVEPAPPPKPPYRGPNVIIVQFGGGVRRRETIDAQNTYSPFLCHDLK